MTADYPFSAPASALPDNAVLVQKSPSNRMPFHARLPARHPASYFIMASGGLGFGLPASVGIALAERDKGTHRFSHPLRTRWKARHFRPVSTWLFPHVGNLSAPDSDNKSAAANCLRHVNLAALKRERIMPAVDELRFVPCSKRPLGKRHRQHENVSKGHFSIRQQPEHRTEQKRGSDPYPKKKAFMAASRHGRRSPEEHVRAASRPSSDASILTCFFRKSKRSLMWL